MFKLKKIPVTYCKDNVIFLNVKSDFFSSREPSLVLKAEIHTASDSICGMVAAVYDDSILSVAEVGLSADAFDSFGLEEGSEVSLTPSIASSSVASIRRKINGGVLSSDEYKIIVNDINEGKYSRPEIAAFEAAFASFTSPQEIYFMINAIVSKGKRYKWLRDTVVDEVCIGGVAGNRVSPIVQSIVVAAGMCMPKILFRKQQEASSTLDVMSILCETGLSEDIFAAMVDSCGAGIVSGTGEVVLSKVERQLSDLNQAIGISSHQIDVISIISNAVLTGVTNLLVDIPVASSAVVNNISEAIRLKKLLEYTANMMGLEISVVITDGSEPVGNGIGPMLEARDVMNVLNCSSEAPEDLREKALFIAGKVLEFDSKLPVGKGYELAKNTLDSGKALECMNLIIENQTGKSLVEMGKMTRDITASSSGRVDSINCAQLNRIALMAGAPFCAGAGVDLMKHSGDKVEQGEVIYRIYASSPMEFAFASGVAEGDSGYKIVADMSVDYI